MEKIKILDYYTVEKGFYEVMGHTDQDKICIEGYVCSGILKQLILQTKKDKGKITKWKRKVLNKEHFPKKYFPLKENKFFHRMKEHYSAMKSNIEKIESLQYFNPEK